MELVPWCSYLLLLLLFLPALVHLGVHFHQTPTRLPPGPWRLPVIGSLHHLLILNDARLVHRATALLAQRWKAPLMYLRLGELHTVFVSSADAARVVIREHDANFSTRSMTMTMRATIGDMVGIVMTPHGTAWRRLRMICTAELLSGSRVRSFRPVREDEAARLARAIAEEVRAAERKMINVSDLVARLVSDTALRAIMGERFRWRDEFLEALAMAMSKGAEFRVADLFPSSRLLRIISGSVRESKALHAKMFELVDRAIDQHRERKSGAVAVEGADDAHDLLDVLLRLYDLDDPDYHLTLPTIKAVILDMFGTGISSTSTTIQWAMLELMRNPRVMQKLQYEIRHVLGCKTKLSEDDLINLKYLKLVIKETFRLHPAIAMLFPKECQESCKILGYDVPQGSQMIINVWAIGRDPKMWDEPEVFKPERFQDKTINFKGTDFQFLPFGSGRRMCPGIMFAHANIELALATLIYHFDWELPPGVLPDAVDMTEKFGVDSRPKKDIYLSPILVLQPEAEA